MKMIPALFLLILTACDPLSSNLYSSFPITPEDFAVASTVCNDFQGVKEITVVSSGVNPSAKPGSLPRKFSVVCKSNGALVTFNSDASLPKVKL